MDLQEQILIRHARKCAIQSQLPEKPYKVIKPVQETALNTTWVFVGRKFQRVPLA